MIAISSLKKFLVKWSTNETKQRVHEGFKNIGGMENVIGAIDGRIVDHKGIFIDYEIRWPGSVHDARVYKNSYFYLNASEIIKGNEFLLGDSAYLISTFLIKPFTNSQVPS
ncbi:7228_t:CDS:2 [Funneliformis geosporum]|nr:7228_t:CDS:2 [Funneliformis geosporum]